MGQVYHNAKVSFGSHDWDDMAAVKVRDYINQYALLVGKPIYGYDDWIANWRGTFDWMLRSGDHGLLPLLQDGTLGALIIGWLPYAMMDPNDSQTMKDIIAGTEDPYILGVAQECKAFGYPLFIRFGAEMNLNQGHPEPASWAEFPADFVEAWRRVVDLFRSQGVTNVKWVWNPSSPETAGAVHSSSEYYPGDSYVDWVGIDMYQNHDGSDPELQMAPLYNDYGARKPIGIFEWGTNSRQWSGVDTPDAVRADYMEKFFNAVESRPKVKLIAYHYIGSFRFDALTPLTLAKYRQRIADSRYISATPTPSGLGWLLLIGLIMSES